MKDQFGRTIEYIRISVTEHCNLKCKYCMPAGASSFSAESENLSYEEMIRICVIMAQLGIKKIKVTGGEPLVRPGICSLIKNLKEIEGIEEVTMTTNGVLLEKYVQKLEKAGLDGINISLDTLNRMRYEELTGYDKLFQVLRGVQKAGALFQKVKINCVLIAGWNEEEILPLAQLAMKQQIDVRFIELMPVGQGTLFKGISNEEIKKRLEERFGKGILFTEKRGNGPAVYYSFEHFQGKIGFISAMSKRFCENCNRIRLTSVGELKLCLHYPYCLNLKNLLRQELSDNEILERIKKAIFEKPASHCFLEKRDCIELKNMNQIGG